jgi:hypothetical protein
MQSVEIELFRADRHDEANCCFYHSFANVPKYVLS